MRLLAVAGVGQQSCQEPPSAACWSSTWVRTSEGKTSVAPWCAMWLTLRCPLMHDECRSTPAESRAADIGILGILAGELEARRTAMLANEKADLPGRCSRPLGGLESPGRTDDGVRRGVLEKWLAGRKHQPGGSAQLDSRALRIPHHERQEAVRGNLQGLEASGELVEMLQEGIPLPSDGLPKRWRDRISVARSTSAEGACEARQTDQDPRAWAQGVFTGDGMTSHFFFLTTDSGRSPPCWLMSTSSRVGHMAIPELEQERVSRALRRYCDEGAARGSRPADQGLPGRSIDVELFERRPHHLERHRHVEHVVAKFRYNAKRGSWTLFWSDSNLRWHAYREVEGFGRRLPQLLRAGRARSNRHLLGVSRRVPQEGVEIVAPRRPPRCRQKVPVPPARCWCRREGARHLRRRARTPFSPHSTGRPSNPVAAESMPPCMIP